MVMIDEILKYNERFVAERRYEEFLTSKYPDKRMAIVTCMDTRLTTLLPAALGLKNGDVKIIKNAGGTVLQPFDSAVRSLLVAVYELGVEEILVIGHSDCGAQHLEPEQMIQCMLDRGISQDHIDMMRYCGIDFNRWLSGFDHLEAAVAESVDMLRHHPLIPADITVRGFIIDSTTGRLTPVE